MSSRYARCPASDSPAPDQHAGAPSQLRQKRRQGVRERILHIRQIERLQQAQPSQGVFEIDERPERVYHDCAIGTDDLSYGGDPPGIRCGID